MTRAISNFSSMSLTVFNVLGAIFVAGVVLGFGVTTGALIAMEVWK